jgi:hypothetical protein
VRIGCVSYGYHDDLDDPMFAVGYWGNNAPPPELNPWYIPRYLKKVDFAFENEIRASMHVSRVDQPIDPGYNLIIGPNGVQTLIESIRLHPNATTDLATRVKSLLSKSQLPAVTVEQSGLQLQGG